MEPVASPPSSAPISPAEGGSPPSPTAPRPAARRSRLWGIVIAAVVVIVVVASLFAAGVIPISSGSKSNTTPSYSEAAAAGQNAANGVAGGPWTLIGAIAIDSAAGLAANVGTASSANCSLAPVGTASFPSTLRIPADGDFSSGQSPYWGLIYINPSAPKILVVEVLNGTATPLAVGSGRCAETLVSYSTIPTNVLDSPTVASDFWSGGGSAFVSAHSGVPLNLIMGLFGGGSGLNLSKSHLTLPATWLFAVSPCGVSGSTGPTGKQSVYVAPFNATSGSVEFEPYFPLSTTATCSNLSSTASGGFVLRSGPGAPILLPGSAARGVSTCLPGTAPVLQGRESVGTVVPRISPPPVAVPVRAAGPDRSSSARGQPLARIVQ